MERILYPVDNNVCPVDISCGEHGGLGYPVEHISCGERRPQDKPTGYTEHYILWVYPVRVSEFYRCDSMIATPAAGSSHFPSLFSFAGAIHIHPLPWYA